MSAILERLEAELNKSRSVLLTSVLLQARHEITQLRRPGWRPIETAPKDDTPVLIYTTNGSIWVATWAYDDQWQPEGMPTMDTTHWMPLPEGPKE